MNSLNLPALHKNQDHETISSRSISAMAWHFLMGAGLITFICFFTLDPEPSLLLSTCVAANMMIMLWAIYQAYQWDILLSPIVILFIGPNFILNYTLGNLGPRIVGEGRYGSNPGTLAYYPQVALLSTIGLLIFCWMIFALFSKQISQQKLRYQDLYWQPWQVISTNSLAILILLYLSIKYQLLGISFRGVEVFFDKWLAFSTYFFVTLAATVSVSVLARATNKQDKLIGLLGTIIPLMLAVGLRYRSFMLVLIINMGLWWLTLHPKQVRSVLLRGSLVAIILFGLGTVVKFASGKGETSSILDNLRIVSETDANTVIDLTKNSSDTDYQYRMGGFEYPSAMLQCFAQGISPMYGNGLIGGVIQGFPDFLRPSGNYPASERLAISNYYRNRCLRYGDTIGIPLTSGLADWNIIGVLIYGMMALYSLITWRIVQFSPRLFVAYLMVTTTIATDFDLFWEDGLFIIRNIGFAWLILLALSPFLMPRWQPEKQDAI